MVFSVKLNSPLVALTDKGQESLRELKRAQYYRSLLLTTPSYTDKVSLQWKWYGDKTTLMVINESNGESVNMTWRDLDFTHMDPRALEILRNQISPCDEKYIRLLLIKSGTRVRKSTANQSCLLTEQYWMDMLGLTYTD